MDNAGKIPVVFSFGSGKSSKQAKKLFENVSQQADVLLYDLLAALEKFSRHS